MARAFSSMPVSVRSYLIFLTLVCCIGITSFLIYIQSENLLLAGKVNKRRDKELHKQPANVSLFHQKLQKIAVAKKSNMPAVNIPSSGLLGRLREAVNQKIQSIENRTVTVKMASGFEKYKNSVEGVNASIDRALNYNVHLFYYAWWGNPETDGKYIHWNHQYLPHWQKNAGKWQQGVHTPPDDIGSNFFPALGPYSSSDPRVVVEHMRQIQSSGAGVAVVSWYPPDQADDNGKPVDLLMPLLLDTAHAYGVKIAVHIEPYKNRSGETLSRHIKYIIDTYGQHPGLYRREMGGRQLPVYYIYDSYQVDSSLWAEALKAEGKHSFRGTQYDGIFLGLYLGPEDQHSLLAAGFDGFYTYFAANGFTKGSSWSNWKDISTFARKNHLLFVPSVGPGYEDTRIRPWNADTTRKRLQGKYFRESFQAALDSDVELISVTSFNEWHEGTQVEQAVPKTFKGFKYEDYSPHTPDFYLQLLKEYVDKFSRLLGSDT